MTPPFFPYFKREKPPHGDIQQGLTFSYVHQPRGLMSVSLFPAPLGKRGQLSMAVASCLAEDGQYTLDWRSSFFKLEVTSKNIMAFHLEMKT